MLLIAHPLQYKPWLAGSQHFDSASQRARRKEFSRYVHEPFRLT